MRVTGMWMGVGLVGLMGCGDKEGDDTAGGGGDDSASAADMCVPPDASGSFVGTVSGDRTFSLDWSDSELLCGGFGAAGVATTVSFEGPTDGGQLIFLFAFPELAFGEAGEDLAVEVDMTGEAVIDAGSFGTSPGDCTGAMRNPTVVQAYNGLELYAYDGEVSCTGGASALLGSETVLLESAVFRGVVGG